MIPGHKREESVPTDAFPNDSHQSPAGLADFKMCFLAKIEGGREMEKGCLEFGFFPIAKTEVIPSESVGVVLACV